MWLAIALLHTPEVHHLAPEIAVVIMGVETDVIGLELDEISDLTARRGGSRPSAPDFKNRILRAFQRGMVDRPLTAFGTMNERRCWRRARRSGTCASTWLTSFRATPGRNERK